MSAAPEYRPPLPAEAVEQVRALNEQYINASRTNDVVWFHHHMADDVLIILSNGRRMRKAEFLAMLRDEPRQYRSLTVHDVTLRVFGATVQVDADAPWELSDGRRGVSRYIDCYRWMDGRWQVISAQVTLLPKVTAR